MDNAPAQNRTRRVPRVSVDFPVILLLDDGRFRCRAFQLSELGMLVVPAWPDLLGRSFGIKLNFEPPNRSLFLSGTAAYSTSDGLGIRFNDISANQQFQLRGYVKACGMGLLKGWS